MKRKTWREDRDKMIAKLISEDMGLNQSESDILEAILERMPSTRLEETVWRTIGAAEALFSDFCKKRD